MADKIGITKNGIEEKCSVAGKCKRHYTHLNAPISTIGKSVNPRGFSDVEVIEMLMHDRMETFVDGNGAEVKVHPEGTCAGQNCAIHNPSNHALKDAPLAWRADRKMMERVCVHGVGHPDPDDVSYNVVALGADEAVYSMHGCDGCCSPAIPHSEITVTPKVTVESKSLPWTGMSLKEARNKLSGLHFAKESLTEGEREILYVAEALLRQIDEMNDEARNKK